MANFEELMKKLRPKGVPDNSPPDDVVPYDENAGTLANVKNFMMNNLATDPGYGAMMPVSGIAQAVSKETAAEAAPLVSTGFKRQADEARQALEDMYNQALSNSESGASGPNLKTIGRAVDNTSRTTDALTRQNNGILQAKLNALDKLRQGN